MRKRALPVLLLAVVGGGASASYWFLLSPRAEARRLVERMHGLPVGEEWYTLLQRLAVTVDNPEQYIAECVHGEQWTATRGMWCELKLQLGRRLLREGATELLPGIARILEATPHEPTAADGPGAGLDSVLAAAGDMEHRQDTLAALEAIIRMGRRAGPALPQVLRIAVEESGTLSGMAIHALGSIGDPAATRTLAVCLRRKDLQGDERRSAFLSLCKIGRLVPEARSELTAAMRDPDPEARGYAAVVLGRAGVPDAAPVLLELLSAGPDSLSKSEIAVVLAHMPGLPEPVLGRLRELQEAGIPEVSRHAAFVLALRSPKSKRGPSAPAPAP